MMDSDTEFLFWGGRTLQLGSIPREVFCQGCCGDIRLCLDMNCSYCCGTGIEAIPFSEVLGRFWG